MPDGSPPAYAYVHLNVQGALDYLGDTQALRGMLPTLCTTLGKDIPAISQLLDQGERHAAARCLHSLKGFVPVFCHNDVALELEVVERLCRGTDASALDAAFAHVAPVLLALADEAAHYLAQPG
ncbi:MAG: Hpt domain-containing protein [Betaproteobacteria bacterium]